MALKTTVKVTINNLSDARYCAGMGVDLIGFSVNPDNPFFLSPDNFKEISEWISGVYFVAELPAGTDVPESYEVGFVHVSSPEDALRIKDKNIILEGTLSQMQNWKPQLNKISNLSFLLINIDADKENTKAAFDEFSDFDLLIGYDLSIEDVKQITERSGAGIALKGSDEIKPGLKDYDELADILESLEVDAPY